MLHAVFRADATPDIGAGHVRRCLTLARTLAAHGWRIGFAGVPDSRRMVPELSSLGDCWLPLECEASAELSYMRRTFNDADILLVDHYQRGAAYEEAARPWVRLVGAFDDLPDRDHMVDLLIDQSAGRKAPDYVDRVPTGCTVLVGSKYVMLRPEIIGQSRDAGQVAAQARRVIVVFGGADPDDVSMQAAAAVADSRFLHLDVTIVVGRGYRDPQKLSAAAVPNTRVLIEPGDLPELMAQADIAIGGSGMTAWELAYLGIPALLIVNSKGSIAADMAAAGAARMIGRAGTVSPDAIADGLDALARDATTRAAMRSAGRRLVDGRGAERVAQLLKISFDD